MQLSLVFLLAAAVIAPCFSQNYYSGDGGNEIRLAIYEPQPHGDMSKEQLHYIQSMLNNNFNRFSAIRLIDQQHLERIISEQNIAVGSGSFREEDLLRIGALVNAQYYLFGTVQNLSSNRYRLNLSITDSSEGVRKATFMKEGSLAALVYEATEELLKGLGVSLTSDGRQELQRQQKAAVQTEQRQAREAARAERNNKTDNALNAAMEKHADYAHRSFLGANIFYQLPNKVNSLGLEIEAYAPFFPFITTGVAGKIGVLILDESFSSEKFALTWSVSPVVGIVWPANQSIKLFADVLFDFGDFGFVDGIFAERFTLSFDIGLQYHIPGNKYVVGLKYRGSFYKEIIYTNSFSLGLSLWWN